MLRRSVFCSSVIYERETESETGDLGAARALIRRQGGMSELRRGRRPASSLFPRSRDCHDTEILGAEIIGSKALANRN